MLDEDAGKAGFIEIRERPIPEPLFLPRGSIRAMVTVVSALAAWVMITAGQLVPGYHLNLLLAILGYYFGFRITMKAAQSHILDATARKEDPLFLPPGLIRLFLIGGFLFAGGVLWKRGELAYFAYAEFFIILAGLIGGFIFAKFSSGWKEAPGYILFNHLKGAVVLLAAGTLAVLLLTDLHEAHRYTGLLLAAVVSFYFGSRSS
jgi:hypothetical protein